MANLGNIAVISKSSNPKILSSIPRIDIINARFYRRIIVINRNNQVANLLNYLLKINRLDIEVAVVNNIFSVFKALYTPSKKIPLILNENSTALLNFTHWLGIKGNLLQGEAVVDDLVLFDGEVSCVRIEPMFGSPGLRASVISIHRQPHKWIEGRVVQLGTTGARSIHDGMISSKIIKHSVLYKHTEGWFCVGCN